jgi:hypothetical protein
VRRSLHAAAADSRAVAGEQGGSVDEKQGASMAKKIDWYYFRKG